MADNVQEAPIPPVPQHTPPIDKMPGSQEKFENTWNQWFVNLREKVNVINALVVGISKLTGTGFPALLNGLWSIRTIQPGDGIDVQDGDGAAGDPTISHADTSSASSIAIDNSGGVVIQDITVTIDTFGHVTGLSATSIDLDPRYGLQPDGTTVLQESLGIGGNSFGGGEDVLFIANASPIPSANPTGGGIIYVEGGALKFRGSSGTITTIAPA